MEVAILLRLVGVVNLIFIVSCLFNVQKRESHLRDFVKKKVNIGLYTDLDEIQYVVTTFLFVEAHTDLFFVCLFAQVLFKGENSADVILRNIRYHRHVPGQLPTDLFQTDMMLTTTKLYSLIPVSMTLILILLKVTGPQESWNL